MGPVVPGDAAPLPVVMVVMMMMKAVVEVKQLALKPRPLWNLQTREGKPAAAGWVGRPAGRLPGAPIPYIAPTRAKLLEEVPQHSWRNSWERAATRGEQQTQHLQIQTALETTGSSSSLHYGQFWAFFLPSSQSIISILIRSSTRRCSSITQRRKKLNYSEGNYPPPPPLYNRCGEGHRTQVSYLSNLKLCRIDVFVNGF